MARHKGSKNKARTVKASVDYVGRPVTLQERAVLFFVVRTVFHFPPL